MFRTLICALAGLVVLAAAAAAGGVTEVGKDPPRTKIRLVMQGDKAIYELTGDIDPGAEKIFAELIRGRPGGMSDREGGWLVLSSMGGDVSTAMRIGSLANGYKIRTYVAPNSYCLSACAMIWVTGYSRWVGRGGVLGFHHPWREVNGKLVRASKWETRIFYKKYNFSEEAIRRFMAPPETLFYLTEKSAAELGIKAHWND